MNYIAFNPSEELTAFVKCYWTLDAPDERKSVKQRILPDGCMEMIFHYGDLYRQYTEKGDFIVQPRCFVFGQITIPLEIEPTGKTGIFSVRFYPEAFTPFTKMSVNLMSNRAVPLETLFGNKGIDLEEEILYADTTEKRIQIIESFLLKILSTGQFVDRAAKSSVALIFELKGQLPIGKLSDQLQINRRQLERKFSDAIGLSPKQLSKIVRLQTSLKMLTERQFTSLTAVAYDNDFYDQSHFINDFKEFTGLSPKDFFADNLRMSTLFLDLD
jgi:AraC-like DNA-binding protein